MKLSKISTKYLKSSFVIEFVVSLVAGLSAFFWAFLFSSEVGILDSRINFRNYINNYSVEKKVSDSPVLLVYLDEATVKNLNSETGSDITSRKYLASLVDVIQQGKPAVIGFDYYLEEKDPQKGGDEAFIKAIGKAVDNGVAIAGGYTLKPSLSSGKDEDADSKVFKTKPSFFNAVETKTYKRYKEVFTTAGFLNLWPQKNISDRGEQQEIVRSHISRFEGSNSFPYAIYKEYRKRVPGAEIPDEDLPRRMYMNFRNSNPENQIKTLNSKNLEMFSKHPALLSEEFLNNFKDRIVLIGNANAGNDIHAVPVNSEPGIFGVLIHSVVLLNLINKDFIIEIPGVLKWIMLAAAFIISFAISRRNELRRVILYEICLIAVYIGLSYVFFFIWSIWIPVISVCAVIMVTSLVVIIARIALSEKDNIDAFDYLSDYIPEKLIDNLSGRIDESLFLPFKDKVYVIAGWSKNLPYSDKYKVSDIKLFIDEYNSLIRNTIFSMEGCFNALPQNGFMGFWPLSFYESDPFDKVIAAAESIRASLESINFRARKHFNTSDDIFMDIVILEDYAYVGSFSSGANRSYSIISDSISGILQIPWMFSSDEKNSIIIYENIKNRLPQDRKAVKLNRKIADRDIFELE